MESVLYLGASMASLVAAGMGRRMGDGEVHFQRVESPPAADAAVHYAVIEERDPARALRRLASRPIDVLLVDARSVGGLPESEALDVLERLFPVHEIHGLVRREHTLVLVDPDAGGARVAFAAGTKHVA